MPNSWADLAVDSEACDNEWAALAPGTSDDTVDSNPWAALALEAPAVNSWASLAGDATDDVANALSVPTPSDGDISLSNLSQHIAALNDKSSIAQVTAVAHNITKNLQASNTVSDIGSALAQYSALIDQLSDIATTRTTDIVEQYSDEQCAELHDFVIEQLNTTTGKAESIKSRTVESDQRGIKVKKLGSRRTLLAVSIMALQRSLADVFLSMMCDRTTHLGGLNLTYF